MVLTYEFLFSSSLDVVVTLKSVLDLYITQLNNASNNIDLNVTKCILITEGT
jgi:hypothetical protein